MKYLAIMTLSIISISCGSPTETQSKTRMELQKIANNEREVQENLLTAKYNITYDWDSLDFNYSIDYEKVIQTKRQLVSDLQIDDIFRRDSSYYLRIQCAYLPHYLILETQDKSVLQPLIDKLSTDEYFDDLILVVEIEKINKGLYEIYAMPENVEEAYLEMDPSIAFFGSGKLIEIKLLK